MPKTKAEVAILYSDLNVVRVPWTDKKKLQQDNVLAIAVLQEDRPVIGNPPSRSRYQAVIEFDWYVLTWTATDSYLGGYDDDDYLFFSLTKPSELVDWRFPFLMPKNSLLFKGAQVVPEQYAKAKEIFNDRNGEMF